MLNRFVNHKFYSQIEVLSTRFWALDGVHNSRRPCGAVSLSGVTHSGARRRCTSLTILVSAVLVLSCRQTDRQTQTESQTEADDRYTHATTVGLSKYRAYGTLMLTSKSVTTISFQQQVLLLSRPFAIRTT